MNQTKPKDETLGVLGLVALIIGSTIGTGVFTTAVNMAADGAHTGAVLVGWAVAGIGMLMLMMVFFGLNKVKPELTNGIYSYASECFGHFVGLNSAWGYWLSAVICNVAFITLLFSTRIFYPAICRKQHCRAYRRLRNDLGYNMACFKRCKRGSLCKYNNYDKQTYPISYIYSYNTNARQIRF